MSRSLLLVICDFLLLSLLAFVRFEDPHGQPLAEAKVMEEQRTEAVLGDKDLIQILTLSLEVEQAGTADLVERLEAVRSSLQEREKVLAYKEALLQRMTITVEGLMEERDRLASEKRIAEQERMTLENRLRVAATPPQVISSSRQVKRNELERVHAIGEEDDPLQAQSPNALFQRYERNHVSLVFTTKESSFWGTTTKTYPADTLLARDGERVYALVHVRQTPFRSTKLKSVSAELILRGRRFNISEVGFLAVDPRIVAIPVPQALFERSGIEPFELSSDPLRYSDAILIGSQYQYYGESPFRLDLPNPRYVRFKAEWFQRIFGKFSPDRGDLILAETGELLGIMINSDYGLVIPKLTVQALLGLDTQFAEAQAKTIRSMIDVENSHLPPDLR